MAVLTPHTALGRGGDGRPLRQAVPYSGHQRGLAGPRLKDRRACTHWRANGSGGRREAQTALRRWHWPAANGNYGGRPAAASWPGATAASCARLEERPTCHRWRPKETVHCHRVQPT